MDSDSRKYLPHGVTVNEFLERLEPPELEEIQSDIAYNFMKQLYEYFYLKKNEIKKAQKNISSELLASFGRQLTETEDIPVQLNDSVQN